MYYKLVLLDGAGDGSPSEWNLTLPAVVGRGEEADVMLSDPSISRRHCKFTLNAYDAIIVQDLGSTNGVYVRDERVKQAAIVVDEPFQIGARQVKIQMVDAPLPEQKRIANPDSVFGTQKIEIYDLG